MLCSQTLIATSPDQARQLLAQTPQLAYALFQAMLLMNIVDPQVLQVRCLPVHSPFFIPNPASFRHVHPMELYRFIS